jgi:hypothetical protein
VILILALFTGAFCYCWVTWGLAAAVIIMFGGVALTTWLFDAGRR